MSQLNDAKFAALGQQGHTGAINDRFLSWLRANGAVSGQLNDAWREMLISQGQPAGHLNDMWFEFLGSLGFTGQINDRELAFWLAGGTIGPSALLTATFHRYGPAGPLPILANQILASQDDPLWGDPNRVGEIDVGSLVRKGAGGPQVSAQDTRLIMTSGGSAIQMDSALVQAEAGMVLDVTAQTPQILTGIHFTTTTYPDSPLLTWGNATQCEGNVIIAENTLTQVRRGYVVLGGYNASGEPDPTGAYGMLAWFDTAGNWIYSSTVDYRAVQRKLSSNIYQSGGTIEEMHIYLDISLLDTPHRSLFKTQHANVEDYTPETVEPWTVTDGQVEVDVSGMRAAAAATDDVNVALAAEDFTSGLLEAKANGVGASNDFVFRSDTQPFLNAQQWRGRTNAGQLEIMEGSISRASAAYTPTSQAHYRITDDGTNIRFIADNTVISHASVARFGNRWGRRFWRINTAYPIKWVAQR